MRNVSRATPLYRAGMEPARAERHRYRRLPGEPLSERAVSDHSTTGPVARMKGGFYHDGRFPDLGAVIDHYNGHFKLNLTANEKRDLIEYLKSL